MRVFVAVAEHGGFTTAADSVDLTPSAISKLMSRLEGRLGVRLMHRTTRRIMLTAEGELFLGRCRDILAMMDAAQAEVSATARQVCGRVKVSVGTAFAKHQLAKILPDFCRTHPAIKLDLSIQDHLVDVVGDQFDLAIRAGSFADSRLVARKIGDVRRHICASPAYLAEHGVPRTPQDLRGHVCLAPTYASGLRQWPFHGQSGVQRMDIGGGTSCDSGDMLYEMALGGIGIVRLADFIVGDALRRGELEQILQPHHVDEPYSVAAVMPHGRGRPQRVQAFVDFLVEHFKGSPWRV